MKNSIFMRLAGTVLHWHSNDTHSWFKSHVSFLHVVIFVITFSNVHQAWASWLVPSTINGFNMNDTKYDEKMSNDNYLTYYAVPAGTYEFKLIVEHNVGQNSYYITWGHGSLTNGTPSIITDLTTGEGDANNSITVNAACNIIFHMTDGEPDGTWACTVTATAPTTYLKANFNNDGDWFWRECLPLGDGTYACVGSYGGCSGFNYQRNSYKMDDYTTSNITAEEGLENTDKCVYIYDPSTKSLTIKKSDSAIKNNYIYFDNSSSTLSGTNKYFVIGHSYQSNTYALGSVDHTNLLYGANTADSWDDNCYYAVIGSGSSFGSGSWGWTNLSTAADYSAPYFDDFNLQSGYSYLVDKASASAGTSITLTEKGNTSLAMNSTQTIQYAISDDGGSTYTTLSTGTTPAAISITSYKFASGTYDAVESTGTESLSENASTYNTSVDAAYTAATTLAMSNLQSGYQFDGWYDGNTQLSEDASYSGYLPTSEKTITARFTTTYTVTYHNNGASSGTAPVDGIAHVSSSNVTVKDNTGLLARTDNKVFAGWATTAERATAGTVDYDPAAGDEIEDISADMNLYPVWKTGYYFISLAGYNADGTLNTTDFTTPKAIVPGKRRTVNGVTFSTSVFRMNKTPNDGDVEQTFAGTYLADGKSCFIYDTKTTQTDISIYVFNDSTDALPIYYRVLKEGSVQDVVSVDIPANSGKVVNIPTITHTKGTRVLFGAGDRGGTGYTKINFTQVKAIETGTAVPQAGQAGFELTVPGRFTTSSAVGSIDGLSCVAGANVVLVSGEKNNVIGLTSSLDVEATQYVQFTTTAPVQLQVTPAEGGRYMYYVKKDSKTRTSSDVRHGARNTMTKVNLPEAGTWYILGGTTSDPVDNINISKIAFAAAPVITYHKNDGSGTTTTGTCNVEANSFDRSGYTFLSWNTETDGSGETYEVDAETLTDLTLYAQWGKNPTITYHTDGSSSGSAPAAATITYNTGITVKDNTGLLQHAHDTVFAGWATSASSATIDYLPNATIDDIIEDIDLYPVWKDGAYFISLSGSSANGTRNDADFLTGQSLSSNNPAYAVNEVAFSRSYFKFGGTPNSSDPQNFREATVGSRFVAYDTKTDNTDIYVYLYNNDAAAKTFYYRVLKEGAIEDVQEVAVAASAKVVFAIPTIEHTKGTRVLFGVSDKDNLFITQIKAVESGAALPQAGQDGFELSFPGRAVGNAQTGSIDGLEFSANANVKILESNYISLTGTSGSACAQYIKFTATTPMQLQVTCDNSRYAFYVKQGTTFTTGTDTEYSAKNATTSINLWNTGDWYILASEAHITKVAFVDLSTITYNLNGGTRFFADPDYYTSEQEVTLHPASKPGYIFSGWYDNAEFTGSPITTIPAGSTTDKTFYAKWTEASCAIGNIFTYEVSGSSAKRDTLPDGTFVNCAPDYATITGGTAVFGAVGNTAYIVAKNHRLEFINAHSRLIINLGCALQEGDSITITGTSSCVYALTASNERSTDIVTSCESDGDTKKSTYIIPAGSPLEGASTLYVWRNDNSAYLLTLTIHRKEWIIEGDGTWSTKLAGVTIDDAVKLRGTITVDVTDAQAKAVTLDRSGTHAGKLIVSAGKELVVAQTVRQFNGTANVPTEEENLVLGSSADGNGALVMGSHNGTNHATVYFYSKSGGAKNSTASINQFIGTPFTGETNNWVYNYYNSWLLKVDYSEDTPAFALLGASDSMDPFAGYCVIYNGDAGHTYEMTGTLVATNDKTCSDLHYVSGDGGNSNNENLLANSWTAPIRIAAFETGDFVKTDATIYIFNSGSKDDVDNKDATKGQYITIPISSADDAVIPSMQSFSVYTNASGGSSVTLDYSKLVYDPAVAGTAAVGPNKAPQREETTRRMRILVQGESGFGDVLSLLEREDMTVGFDNGWDGRKMYGESFAPQFYAVTPDGNMAVNSVPDWEGTVLGFKAGTEDTQYTFSFEYNEPEPLYLLDIDNNTYTRVLNENTYTFATTDKNDHSRFILTRHAPQTPTGMEEVMDNRLPDTGARKLLIDDHIYILRDGRLYNVTGALLK